MTASEKKLLTALVLMVRQYLAEDRDGIVDSASMTAGEHAIAVLVEHGLMTQHSEGGRLGRWTKAAEEF